MRPLIFAAVGALFLIVNAMETWAYGSADLLKACTEADNDARWGEVAELECEQYILGFVDALKETGNTSICVPEFNTADEIRWAFMRWVHEDYTARKALSAGAAIMGALNDNFSCN